MAILPALLLQIGNTLYLLHKCAGFYAQIDPFIGFFYYGWQFSLSILGPTAMGAILLWLTAPITTKWKQVCVVTCTCVSWYLDKSNGILGIFMNVKTT